MRFEVVGGGALGLLYSARLSAAGHRVRIWTRTEQQAALLSEQGIEYTDAIGAVQAIEVTAASTELLPARRPGEDQGAAVLLAVKQVAIGPRLYSLLERLSSPETPVICLQNGIGHMAELRSALPGFYFAAGVTTEGALRTGKRSVRHTGRGSLWLEAAESALAGTGREALERAEEAQKMLLSAMTGAGINMSVSNDINNHIFRKLLINAVINPLTALTGVKNGELPVEPYWNQLMKAVCEETVEILKAEGMRLDGDAFEMVLDVCAQTAANESSMLADLRSGRTTEVDRINGGIVHLAERQGRKAPLNGALQLLVKAASSK